MVKFLGLNRVQPEYSFDPGAAAGPTLSMIRDSASPAAADLIAALKASGRNSTGVLKDYAELLGTILDPNNGVEDGEWLIRTLVAGTLATRVHVGQGIYADGVTGGDKGAGSANFTTLYQNNVQVTSSPIKTPFVSAEQTVAAGDDATIAHGLAVSPIIVFGSLINKTAEHGYSVGDKISIFESNADARGVSIGSNTGTANLFYKVSTSGISIIDKSTGAGNTSITAGSWRLILVAIALV